MKKAIERTKALLSNWCCDELKEAAQAWLNSIGTDKEKEAGRKYVLELQDSIVTVDGMLAFLPTDEAKAKFGEETANDEHAKELKAQGIANCDCPACTAASAVLELKDEILK